MTYVDGFVIAVPKGNCDKIIAHARDADQAFLDHGAIRVVECWADDVPDGKRTDFRRAVQATDDEEVAFSWIAWPDKATRDAAMARIMADPQFGPENNPMPFDGKRMIFGGFLPVVTMERPR